MAANNYRTAKVSFVSDTTGSSISHINLISLVALVTIALHSSLTTRSFLSPSIPFLLSWSILVLPLLLSMTLFAHRPGLLSFLLSLPTAILLLTFRKKSEILLPSSSPKSPRSPEFSPTHASEGPDRLSPLPSLTVYRAHMLLMTFLAILAVDFPIFPRSLAKCENFGVSLMDLGVGSFVFSQGIVSAIPILRNPSYLSGPALPKVFSVTRKTLPVLILGIVRIILVKGTNYPEHETEYGTHWNFFITLALLPIIQVVFHPVVMRVPVGLAGVAVAVAQETALSYWGVQEYVFNAPRLTLFSANKEGIVSLTGYFALHLLGLSAGILILPPSPKYFRRALKAQRKQQNNSQSKDREVSLEMPRQNDKTAIELISYSAIWWTLLGFLQLFGIGKYGVSRRVVNLQYIFWVSAYNTSFIFGYLLLDLVFFPSKSVYSPTSKLKVRNKAMNQLGVQESERPPLLLDAINKNGLVLFLVANIATGLVNLSIPTMYTSDFWAMVILGGYALGLCWAAWVLRDLRLLRVY